MSKPSTSAELEHEQRAPDQSFFKTVSDRKASIKASMAALNKRLEEYKKPEQHSVPSRKFKISSGDQQTSMKIHTANATQQARSEEKALKASIWTVPEFKLNVQVITTSVSVVWALTCICAAIYTGVFSSISLLEIGGLISLIFAPIALLWLFLSNMRRVDDMEAYTKALRAEMKSILLPQGESPEAIKSDIAHLCDQARALREASKDVHYAVSRARQGLQTDIQAYLNLTETSEKQAARITRNLNHKSEAMLDMSEVALKRADKIDQKIERGVKKWEAAAGAFENRLGLRITDIKNASKTAERATKDIEASSNTLQNRAEEYVDIIETMKEDTRLLGDAVEANIIATEEGAAKISNTLKSSTDEIDAQKTKLEDLAHTLDIQSENIFDVPVSRIEAVMNQLDARHENITSALDRHIDGLEEVGVNVSDKLNSAVTRVAQQNERFAENTKETLKNIGNVSEALMQNVKALDMVSSRTETVMGNINQNIKVNAEDLKATSDKSIEQLRGLDHQINDNLSTFDNASKILNVQVSETCTSFKALTEENILPDTDHISKQMTGLRAQFDTLGDEAAKIVETNLSKFENISGSFKDQIESLGQVSKHVSQSLGHTKEELKGYQQALIETGDAAEKRMQEQLKTLSVSSDLAATKLSNFTDNFAEQGAAFSHVIKDSIEKLETASETFTDSMQMTGNVSDTVIAGMTEAIMHTEIQAERLEQAAMQSLKNITSGLSNAKDTATQTLSEMDMIQGSLTAGTSEIEAAMQETLRMSGNYSQELCKQVKLVSKSAAEGVQSLAKNSDALTSRLRHFETQSRNVQGALNNVEKEITNRSDALRTISAKVVSQSELMQKITAQVASAIEDSKQSQRRQESDAFISSARYVLESIYALSVDLTRALDGQISEKMWKAYQRGDISVFIERLKDIGNRLPIEDVAKKIRHDHEFRLYSGRYVKQFETLYNDAKSQDHDNILSKTIACSDVAKLYKILCRATSRIDVTEANS